MMENSVVMNGGNNVMAVDNGLLEELNKYKADVKIHPVNGRFDKHGNPYFGIIFHFDDINGKKDRKAYQATTVEELWKKREEFITSLYYQKQVTKEQVRQATRESAVKENQIIDIAQILAEFRQPAVAPCKVTVKEAVDSFLNYYKPMVSYQTYKGEITNANHIKRLLGDKLVTEVTFIDFQSLVNTISQGKDGKQAAEKTVRNIIISFKRLMKYCRKQKWLSLDDLELITSGIKIPTYITDTDHELEVKKSKHLDYEQVGAILRTLEKNRIYYFVTRILFLTGMRPQEFFALEKSDLVPAENYINVCQALVIQEKKGETDRTFGKGTTKNKFSRRKVPAIPVVFKYFEELEKTIGKEGGRKKALENGNGNMVFVDRNGNIANVHTFGVNMDRYIQRHMTGVKLTLNMPRHCYQDYLDKLKAKDSDVEKAVGHVLNQVSERYYKAGEYYIERLLPYIQQMENDIECAYKNQ